MVNFSQVPDRKDFSLLPIGRYAAQLVVKAYQTDGQGQFMTDGQGNKQHFLTTSGDIKWNLEWHLMEPAHKDKPPIGDSLSFGAALWRVRMLWVRGGFAEGKEDTINLEPEDIDGSCWWIDVMHRDPARKDGRAPKPAKRPYSAFCTCAVCPK